MRSRPSRGDALLLGAVQGPTELLPVSSSAHIALLARAMGASRRMAADAEIYDTELYDALEVALHGGAALALLLVGRHELRRAAREMTSSRFVTGVLAAAPPALAGWLLERGGVTRAPGPRTIAAGLALGGVAMALADRRLEVRELAEVGPRDGLALGIAQALALLPGVSRNGATLTAARARGFERRDAQALSWRVGLPVLLGATGLRAQRLWRGGGVTPAARRTLMVGVGAAFASTLASAGTLRGGQPAGPLLPFALYRVALATLVVRRCGESPAPPAGGAQ
ncbi:MAG TPA: undecaprenyl-diphosphate phosphatase [Solirubrobacteraceae bacterium]|jgi:undecaprenyl-diphosphatase